MFFCNLLVKFQLLIIYYYKYLISCSNHLLINAHLCIKFTLQSKLNYMKKFIKISSILFGTLALVMVLVLGGFFLYINTAKSAVSFDKELLQEANTTIDIYDQNNNKINATNGKKALVAYEELPNYVKDAFISIEDKDFYKHSGLNYKRIAKAFVSNIKSKSLKEGASTISQQLIKNTHLSSEKTIQRKINEMALTIQLEKTFSKDEILETYLNVIYFGNGAYGLENASYTYFGKPATSLTIAQSALLAGMIKSPKNYSPILNYDNAIARRNLVLKEMKKDGKITEQEYQTAISEPIEITNKTLKTNRNFYEEATLLEAEQILDLSSKEIALGQYKIWTYQNPIDQKSLSDAINNQSFYLVNEYGNTADSCGVVIDNKTGGITAFDGKSVYDIINMKRSPGSSLKPVLVYAPALESGKISPSTPILDEQTSFANYSPQNVGGIYYGWIDATKSVEKSLNIPAIKILKTTGIEYSKKYAQKCGIDFENSDNNYAIALGAITNGTTVTQLANSYIPFANSGEFIKAKFIKKICNKNGDVVYQNNEKSEKVFSKETAYLMTSMLKSGVQKGTSSRLNSLNFEIAGKTGTVGIKNTNLNSDAWSVAYTPQKTACTWLGNSTGEKEYMLEGKNNGGTATTSMLKAVFEGLDIDKNKVFVKPDGIVELEIDKLVLEKEHKLEIANKLTSDRYKVKAEFNKKYAPTVVADAFDILNFCTLSGKIENKKPVLEFSTSKSATYTLYRIEEDVCKELKTFKNVSGTQTYVDTNAKDGNFYTYYVSVIIESLDNKKIESNNVEIEMPSSTKNNIKKMFSYW